MEKEVIRKYLVITIIIVIAIGILFLVNTKFTGNMTGKVIYGIAGAPTVSSVSIIPSNPTPDDNLTGSVDASDAEGDNITYWYSWYKDDGLNATTLIDDGLVSYWSLDNDVLDYYGDNDGTNNGATLTTNGKLNGSYSFDGSNDYISISHSELLFDSPITVGAWIMIDTVTGIKGIAACGYGAGTPHWLFQMNGDKLRIYVKNAYYSGGTSLSTGTWYHVAFTGTAVTGGKIYLNGVEDGTISAWTTGGGIDVRIGTTGGSQFFDGKIDEFMIFNRSLSESEIQQLYYGSKYGGNVVDSSKTSDGETWILGAKAGDNTGWSLETNSSSVIILSNQPPTITLIEPQNTLYTNNESLALNFTVSDDNDLIENLTCWYNVDNGSNVSISNCENTTFNTSDEATHTLTIFANDSAGLESSDSVIFTVDALGISLSISEPIGTKTSRTSIPLQFTATGNNLSCWYNVKTSIGGDVIDNTTLNNCQNTTFSVSNDGDYVLNLFANNIFGSSDSDSSSFSIELSDGNGGSSGGGGRSRTTIVQNLTTEIYVSEISDLIVNPGDSKKIFWEVKNTGISFLNDCKLEALGEYSSWFSVSGIKNLAAGEEHEFIITINVPEDIGVGKYTLGVLLNCQETNKSVEFVVEILEQKLDLRIIEVVKDENGVVKIFYSLKELSGIEQDVDLQFLLFTQDEEKITEVTDSVHIKANSIENKSIDLLTDSSLKGEFKLLININSDTYSSVIQEDLILGKSSISGFSIFGESRKIDNIIALVLIIAFLVFAVFIIRYILKSRKK